MTVSTFYPDANAVDGHVNRITNGVWLDVRNGAGENASAAVAIIEVYFAAFTTSPQYDFFYRGFTLFDTASLPDSDTIDSATFEYVVPTGERYDGFTPAGSMTLVNTTPATNTALVTADYAQSGSTRQVTDVLISTITADSATYNVMTLNATGRASIAKTGITKFGPRVVADLDDTPPTWASAVVQGIQLASAEEVLAGDKRPKLVVTHTAPPSTFTPKMLVF